MRLGAWFWSDEAEHILLRITAQSTRSVYLSRRYILPLRKDLLTTCRTPLKITCILIYNIYAMSMFFHRTAHYFYPLAHSFDILEIFVYFFLLYMQSILTPHLLWCLYYFLPVFQQTLHNCKPAFAGLVDGSCTASYPQLFCQIFVITAVLISLRLHKFWWSGFFIII